MQPEPEAEPLTKVCTDALGGAEPWITRLVAFVIPSEDESPVSVAGVSERLVGAAVPWGTVVVVVDGVSTATGATIGFGGVYEQPDNCTGREIEIVAWTFVPTRTRTRDDRVRSRDEHTCTEPVADVLV